MLGIAVKLPLGMKAQKHQCKSETFLPLGKFRQDKLWVGFFLLHSALKAIARASNFWAVANDGVDVIGTKINLLNL